MSAVCGRSLKCRARLEADRLVLEESGEDGLKTVQVFTPVPPTAGSSMRSVTSTIG